MPGDFVVVDIETTGLSPRTSAITEIGAVILDSCGEKKETFQTLVNPRRPIPWSITRLTGIDDKMVQDAPTISEALPDFLEFLGDGKFVAHNASFDHSFLSLNARSLGHAFPKESICTRRLATRLFAEPRSKSLGALCCHFELRNDNAHRALSDAMVTADLFKIMLEKLYACDINEASDIIEFSIMSCAQARRRIH